MRNRITSNPVVPFSLDGRHLSTWYNFQQTLDSASVRQFEIGVFANTAQDAYTYASMLKNYLESNPPVNVAGFPDDVSVGVRHARYDPLSQGYRASLNVMSGRLRSFAPKKKKTTAGGVQLVHNGVPVTHNGVQVVT